MRYVAAYLLAALGGKSPTAADIEKILGSVGIEAESDKIKKIISELNGKDLNTLIEEGQKKLQSVPSGGGAVAVSAVASSGGGGGGGAAATETKKEEKKAEPESESEDEDMGFGLFD